MVLYETLNTAVKLNLRIRYVIRLRNPFIYDVIRLRACSKNK